MNRIDITFDKLKKEEKKALITFVTAGDPDIETTKELILAMENAGASIIELGIPFSDPVAEGPVIQEANIRALKQGVNLDIIFNAVSEVRKQTQIPLVFLMYYNSVLSYGLEQFFETCQEAGVDGVIIPDLPYEESGEIASFTNEVYQIQLIAPTSRERAKKIAQSAKGFLYCVSSMGVTGVRNTFETDFEEFFTYINEYTEIPKCIGFGISTPEQAGELKQYCDGVIVGSAIVTQVAAGKNTQEKIQNAEKLTRELKDSIR